MHALDANTLDLWRMNEASGTTFQNLASARHLTVVNAPVPAAAPRLANSSTGFAIGNYSQAYLTQSDPVAIHTSDSAYTIEFWIYRFGTKQPYPTAYIVSNGWPVIYTNENGALGYMTRYWNAGNFWSTDNYSVGVALTVEAWNHVALVFSAKFWNTYYWYRNVYSYVNGVYRTTQTPHVADLYFGGFGAATETNFSGILADARFSSCPRTAEEIAAEYNSAPDLPPTRSLRDPMPQVSSGVRYPTSRRSSLLRFRQISLGAPGAEDSAPPNAGGAFNAGFN